jgi:tetratricopeptide (TPR) repeat protein
MMRSFATLLTVLIFLGINSASAQEAPDPNAEFGAFFASLKDALTAGNSDRLRDLVDVGRFWTEVRKTCGETSLAPELQEFVKKALGQRIGSQLSSQAAGLVWKSLSVERVRPLALDREALVVARTVDADGYVLKHRFWLIRGEDHWRFYDMERVGAGLRMSDAAAAMMGAVLTGNAEFGRTLPGLLEALTAWEEGDVEQAALILEGLPDVELPGRVEGLRQFILGQVHLWNGRAEQALSHFAAAEKANPDMGIVDLARAGAFLELGRAAEALACAERYLSGYGDDPAGRIAEGQALEMFGRQEDALAAYRKALTDAPESTEALLDLAYALPDGRKQEIADWFRRHPDPVGVFWEIIDPLIEDGEREAAVALLAAFRAMAPGNHLADIAEGWLLANAGEYEKAAGCYRRALEQEQDPEERAPLQTSYLDAMVRSDRPVEGYLTFPGSSRAFREVCGVLLELGEGEAILEVARAHAKELPDDLWLQFHRARGLSLTGDHDGAEQALAAGMARAADDATREEFRDARVANLYDAGRGLSAYGLVGPRRPTFRDLAEYFSLDGDTESLAALVGAHAGADPDDPALRLYRGELLWLLGELEPMVELLDGLQATIAGEPDLLLLYEDRLVRGLARLGRVKEALRVAQESTRRDDNPHFEAVVHAIAGDVAATGRVLVAMEELGYAAEDFWDDEDIARALATDAFVELRKRYPEPK